MSIYLVIGIIVISFIFGILSVFIFNIIHERINQKYYQLKGQLNEQCNMIADLTKSVETLSEHVMSIEDEFDEMVYEMDNNNDEDYPDV
jgi:peptidoglycan hydrolase CwlO-like protein